MVYAFSRLRAKGRDFRPAYDALRHNDYEALVPAKLWGAFHGLFGLASNELIVVTSGEAVGVGELVSSLPEVASAETLLLEPTVRPTTDEPRTREGLYVFRFFDVAHKDVDEIAKLSLEAWEHFENVDRYRAIPQGLFRQHDTSAANGKMLLCTWYDGLPSWQESRAPPGPAGERFRRRHMLTQGTIAYATRLLAT